MKFIIFHGAFGNPESNWFPELKEKLAGFGQKVIVPRFPVDNWEDVTRSGRSLSPKQQTLEKWLKTFRKSVLPLIKSGEKLCFVAHSLGPLFILHVIEKFNLQLDSAIFVSPFFDRLDRVWQIDHVNQSFYKTNFNFEKLKKLIPVSYVLYSDNDPYVDKKHSILFAKLLDSSLIFVKRAGHMNSEVNLNEFPLVLDLCLTRLDLSLYQRYLEHRRTLYALEYVKSKPRGIIKLKPKEVIDEGVFHFRHLQKEGFCTFFTRINQWDPRGRYYKDARLAARRVKNFTRIFIVNKISDLKRKLLREQIKLDIESNILIYLCMFEDVGGLLPEPDFGIWDRDYVCIIHLTPVGEMSEIELNSTKEGMEMALKWKEIVLKRSVKIVSLGDVDRFIINYKDRQIL